MAIATLDRRTDTDPDPTATGPLADERRALAIVDRLLELDPAERDARVVTECDGDPTLCATVLSLLDQPEDDALFVTGGAHPGFAGPRDEPACPAQPVPGERLGPYRIVRELGRGGMGVVYLGERADGLFEQEVAIKLLPPGGDDDLARRLENERSLLAALAHPGIARLFDGGVTPGGRPYLVMERIEGRPIDRFCEEEELGLEARLRIFLQVCDAVEAAHRRLIVHRDIKPGNVLVTDDATPKLLDFGIAKILGGEAPGRPETQVMTLTHASPEQLRGEPLGVASDVHQLGTLLFELLTGQRPHEGDERSVVSQVQAICHEDPPAPSRVVEARERLDAATGNQDRGTAFTIPRDLDLVTLKALARHPETRYATARELRNDVDRFLRGRAVEARPHTWGYLAQRFLSRHAVASAAVFAGVVVLTTTGMVSHHRLAAERDVAEARRLEALAARDLAEEVSQFLVDLFAVAVPGRTRGETVTARELLDRGATRLEADLAGEPAVQAQMGSTMGFVYSRLGLYPEAEELLETALERQVGTLPPSDPRLLRTRIYLAELRLQTGEASAAEEQARTALRLLGTDEGLEGSRIRATAALGEAVRQQGRTDEARAILARVLEMRRRAEGPEAPATAPDLVNLANASGDAGDYASAEVYGRRALAILDGDPDPHPASLFEALNTVGTATSALGRPAEAESFFTRGLALAERIYAADHPRLSTARGNLAISLAELGRTAEAEVLHREILASFEGRPEHRDRALVLVNLGNLHLARDDFAGARRLYSEAAEAQTALLGADHPSLATTWNNLGEALVGEGRLEEAVEVLEKSRARFAAAGGEDGLLVSWPTFQLGRAAEAAGRRSEAARLYRRTLEIREGRLPPGADELREVHAAIARVGGA